MKRLAAISLLLASINAYAEALPTEAMPENAQKALRAQLSKRVGARLSIGGVDDSVAADVKELRDKQVLEKIESDFDKIVQQRPLVTNTELSGTLLRKFEATTKARLELQEIAVSNIPEDKLIEAVGVTKSELKAAAASQNPDTNLLKRLTDVFPKSVRGSSSLLNPLTPVDTDIPPTLFGPVTFDPKTGRSTQLYARKRFGIVGVLADVSVTPYKHICSGTLISDNWFLTATHCLFDSSAEKRIPPDRLGVFFPYQGGTVSVLRSDGKESKNLVPRPLTKIIAWFGEANGAIFPSTEPEMESQIRLGNDVAIVGLVSSTSHEPDPRIVHIPTASAVTPPLTLAGYGLTNALNTVGDLLLEVGVRKDIVVSDDTGVLLKSGPDSSISANGRICFGDSGGPVFLGSVATSNSFQLVAIASSVASGAGGINDCAVGVQRFTRIDRPAVRAWLCAKAGAGC